MFVNYNNYSKQSTYMYKYILLIVMKGSFLYYPTSAGFFAAANVRGENLKNGNIFESACFSKCMSINLFKKYLRFISNLCISVYKSVK